MIQILLVAAVSVAVAPAPQPVERAWSILQRGVESRHTAKRVKAVHALGLLVDDEKAQRLADGALGDESPAVRVAAADALGCMKAVSSAPRLSAALSDAEQQVVLAAANSLFRLGRLTAFEAYGAVLQDADGGDGVVGTELKSLKDPKVVAKMGFEEGIGFIPFAPLGYKIFKRIRASHATSPARVAAALELATDPDSRAARALTNTCDDKDWHVRVAVVDAIAVRNDPLLLAAVIPMVEDDNDTVKYEAAAAVVRLSARRSGPDPARRTPHVDTSA